MSKFFTFIVGLVCILLFSVQAQAVPVEYRFTGVLTGDTGMLGLVRLVDAPFQISIYADTDNVFATGYVAGAGPGFANNSVNATWEVAGLGTATSTDVQIYSLPGLARVAFAWNGQAYPLSPDQPVPFILTFSGNAIAMDPAYGHLGNIVDATPVTLRTNLKNPPNMLPEYTTYVDIEGNALLLKEISGVSYSVVATPLPPTFAFLAGGLGLLLPIFRRRND
jgi:hypothetical protein